MIKGFSGRMTPSTTCYFVVAGISLVALAITVVLVLEGLPGSDVMFLVTMTLLVLGAVLWVLAIRAQNLRNLDEIVRRAELEEHAEAAESRSPDRADSE